MRKPPEGSIPSFDEYSAPTPRGLMSPHTTAHRVITFVFDAFDRLFGDYVRSQGNDAKVYFIENVFKEACREGRDGDAAAEEFFAACDRDDENAYGRAMLHVADIALAYAIQALTAKKDSPLAWSYAVDATYWMGVLLAGPFGKQKSSNPASELAKLRHKENYEMAADVERYWRENIDPMLSAERAAEQVVRAKLVPLGHKKIAQIISRLRKAEGLRTR